ncbi:MAG TPA: hypothetical protein VFI90_11695 [Rubrobacter sp.]|nr:hypothetical protein [Rubrobacter sp.]
MSRSNLSEIILRRPSAMMAAALVAMLLALIAIRPAEAAFPGTNGQIVFTSDRDGGDYEIYTANSDGTSPRRLTFHAGYDLDPAWSPTGKIVFARYSGSTREALYTMNASSGNLRRVVRFAYDPAWSPNGSRIVFHSGGDIYTIKPDGTGRRQVTSGRAWDEHPVWSPNGSRIAFNRSPDPLSESLGIYTITTRGTGLRHVTFGNDFVPDWSPDGTRLVFENYNRGTDTHTISTVNANGSGLTPLRSGWFIGYPVFSPDGTKIAYYGAESVPGYQVFAINASGSGTPTALTSVGNSYTPDWRPGP